MKMTQNSSAVVWLQEMSKDTIIIFYVFIFKWDQLLISSLLWKSEVNDN